jgi:hypothetical protein
MSYTHGLLHAPVDAGETAMQVTLKVIEGAKKQRFRAATATRKDDLCTPCFGVFRNQLEDAFGGVAEGDFGVQIGESGGNGSLVAEIPAETQRFDFVDGGEEALKVPGGTFVNGTVIDEHDANGMDLRRYRPIEAARELGRVGPGVTDRHHQDQA